MPETGNPVQTEEEDAAALAEGGIEEGVTGSNGNGAVDRNSAAGMFAELVRTHYDVEKHPNETDVIDRYHRTLEQFEAFEGEITHVYWSTKRASAVALTVKR